MHSLKYIFDTSFNTTTFPCFLSHNLCWASFETRIEDLREALDMLSYLISKDRKVLNKSIFKYICSEFRSVETKMQPTE